MKLTIEALSALEILDSRGRPTLEVQIALSNGTRAAAQVPSGASTGMHEALELRDRDQARYGGHGVLTAAMHVEGEIATALRGMDASGQAAIDRTMIALDGTPGKSRLGANAILGVSCAVARATALARGEDLWQVLNRMGSRERPAVLPVPMVNILSGGWHAGFNFEFQDFLAIAHGFPTYAEALRAIAGIHGKTRELLVSRGCLLTGVADEGGWGPKLARNEDALRILTEAIETAGYRPAEQVSIAIDAATSHFYREGRYHLPSEGRVFETDELIELYAAWMARYPLCSLEDGLDQDDWAGWQRMTARLGAGMQVIGDDFFTTNPARLQRGIEMKAANAVLVKMNQIGTLTETFEVLDLAAAAGFRAVVSARSGETEDSFLADLAVGSGAGQIKVGSITRSERLSKYNRLLRLEREGRLTWRPASSFPYRPAASS